MSMQKRPQNTVRGVVHTFKWLEVESLKRDKTRGVSTTTKDTRNPYKLRTTSLQRPAKAPIAAAG